MRTKTILGSSATNGKGHSVSSLILTVDESYSVLKIAELTIGKPKQAPPPIFPLLATLRVGPIEIKDEQFSFRLGIKELWLELDPKNCKIAQGTRFGELDRDVSRRVEVEVMEHHERQADSSVEGEGGIREGRPFYHLGASGKHRGTKRRTKQSAVRRTDEERGVIAEPFGRWLIKWMQDDPEPFLRGRYIRDDSELCKIEIIKRKFSVTARVLFECRHRNIHIDEVESAENGGVWYKSLMDRVAGKANRNRQRAMELLATRALREEDAVLCLCEHRATPLWEETDNENAD
jgi:hypothetical protein